MHILRIEHPVPDYDAWKEAFDSNPISREHSGVRRYRILRPMIQTTHDRSRVRQCKRGRGRSQCAARAVESGGGDT